MLRRFFANSIVSHNLTRGGICGSQIQGNRFFQTDTSKNNPIKIGDQAQLTKTFSSADVKSFAEISCDDNPIHLDEEFAKKTRFGRPIVHGVLSVGLLSGVLGNKLPGPGSIVLTYTIQHPAPLYVNETATAQVKVKAIEGRKVTFDMVCFTDDDKVVTKGEAQLLVPKSVL